MAQSNSQPSASLIIGGDLCPLGRSARFFVDGDAEAVFHDLLPELRGSDLSVVGLEGPLVREKTPVQKAGMHISADEACIKGVQAAGIGLLNLANNHTMDHGVQGLRNTIRTCQSNRIDYVGAGENLQQARQVFGRDINGIRVGIVCMAEHEFGVASTDKPGVNPLDIIDFARNSARYRSEYDCLVVLLHGGNEYYPYPRPGLMDTCRFLVEQGAGAVICQHTHCAGCMETYRGAPIVYGQGNLLFDVPAPFPVWHEGALIGLTFRKSQPPSVDLIPLVQSDARPGARRMTEEEAAAFRSEFVKRSEEIQDPSFVQARWLHFCLSRERHYLHTLHGKATLLRRIAGKMGLLHRMDSSRTRCWRLNLIHCESHREAVVTLLSMDAQERCKIRKGLTASARIQTP